MKKLLIILTSFCLIAVSFGDIHEPPRAKYGATRKLSRGVANVLFGGLEVPYQISVVTKNEGSTAGATHGVIRGVQYTGRRFIYGLYEIFTFPFPTTKGDYRPPYKSELLHRHKGYDEFPPEAGFSAKYDYTRDYRFYGR